MKHTLERIDDVLGSLRVGILAIDADGRVELENPEASRILGQSLVAALGRQLRSVLGAQHPATLVLEPYGEREVLCTRCARAGRSRNSAA